jgi:hypothetical protein
MKSSAPPWRWHVVESRRRRCRRYSMIYCFSSQPPVVVGSFSSLFQLFSRYLFLLFLVDQRYSLLGPALGVLLDPSRAERQRGAASRDIISMDGIARGGCDGCASRDSRGSGSQSFVMSRQVVLECWWRRGVEKGAGSWGRDGALTQKLNFRGGKEASIGMLPAEEVGTILCIGKKSD